MAAEPNFGMDKGLLKSLLNKSKTEPVSCAVGKGKEPGVAYILLDKIKQGRQLQTALEKDFADIKDPRRGTASVDTDINPKLVVFTLNRPASGLAPRLLKVLKQVGFSKIQFQFEDGSEPEHMGEDEEGVPTAPPMAGAPVPIDVEALRKRLTELVKRLPGAIAADPSRKDALMALAKQAQLMLGTNNLKTALKNTDDLEAALGPAPAADSEAAPAGTAPEVGPAATAAPQTATSGPVAYAKSRLAWIATRRKMESDLDTLRKKIIEEYKDMDIVSELDTIYAERVAPVLANLDETLADTLDDATNAEDPVKRSALVAESREIIKRYQSFMASEPLFAELDANPFVPLSIAKTMNATLATLSAAIR